MSTRVRCAAVMASLLMLIVTPLAPLNEFIPAPRAAGVTTTCPEGVPFNPEWATQQLESGTNGIDGYIRQSGLGTMADPCNHLMSWITLCNSIACNNWVQNGQYQGLVGILDGNECSYPVCIWNATTAVHSFWEMQDACGTYVVLDDGQPPSPNYPYYIKYTNYHTTFLNCPGGAREQYRFYVYEGGLSNMNIVGTGWLPTSWGFPIAGTEHFWTHEREVIGLQRFGLNSAFNYQEGYALHLFTIATNTWALWNQSGTYPLDGPNLIFEQIGHPWSAFKTHE